MNSANSGLKVRTSVRAGGMNFQHNRRVLKVRTTLKSGGVTTQHNRRLLNTMDKSIRPKTTAEKIALAPVMIPVGSAALATDAALIHPAHSIPKAWKDVYDLYWKPRGMTPLRQALFLPIVSALTPPTFAGAWMIHSAFPID
jgi:hypothetical protein